MSLKNRAHNEHETSAHHELPEEYSVRVAKVKELESLGFSAWPAMREVTATCAEVENIAEKTYVLAGRIMTIRLHGKALFATLHDRSGALQIYIKQEMVGQDQFDFFNKYIDNGDIVWCQGTPFITKTGELTLRVTEFSLLSKCLYPMPEKFHGIENIETKYRQRYLDLMTSDETKKRFKIRSTIIKTIRAYLDAHDFIEVETPMLHPIAGGAAARPFITHHNALDSDFYLRIAPELYLKRLVIGGLERVYEINRNFRNEGVSTRHNPEFTMLEMYMAHNDYHFIMGFVENLIRQMVQTTNGVMKVPFGQHTIDFEKPFARTNVQEALIAHGGLTVDQLTEKNIDTTLKQHKVTVHAGASLGKKLFLLFEELAESKLINPTFLIDFPIEISPLAKRDAQNPAIAARFELFIAGMEISNGFNELNDPFDQAERFKEQMRAYGEGDEEAHQYDADYILALEHGLPPTVGVGIGIDRLVMLLTNTTSIKEVILFPTLKKKENLGAL